MLLFALASILLAQSQTEEIMPTSMEFIQYKDGEGNITYSSEYNNRIGRHDDNSSEIRYRTRYEFWFYMIPGDARINWVRISFSINNGSSSDYRARIVKVPNIYLTDSEGWNQIQNSGTVYFDNLSYNQDYYDVSDPTLTSDVINAIQSYDQILCLGSMSLNENIDLTDADLEIDHITVNYTPKITVTIRNSFGGGTVEVDGNIVQSPWTSPSSGPSAWYSGDSHTIRAYTQTVQRLTYPFLGIWTNINTGGNITQGSENTPIAITPTEDCTWQANFGEPGIQVTVEQKLSNGTSIGSIGHWENGNFISYPVPKEFLFELQSTQVLRSYQGIVSGEKFNNWSIDNNVKNHREFSIGSDFPQRLVANFKPVASNITISVNIPGSHTIQFKDPWYIDYADTAYGNNLRNRGFEAIYRTRTTPFHPDYSTTYENGQSYKGVFLNQNEFFNDSDPIYSLRAPLLVTEHNGSYYYFHRWTGDSVAFNAQGSTSTGQRETPVVFKAENATATAEYYHLTVDTLLKARLSVQNNQLRLSMPYLFTIHNHSFYKIIPTATGAVSLTLVSSGPDSLIYQVTLTGNGGINHQEQALAPNSILTIATSSPSIPAGTLINMPAGSKLKVLDVTRLQGTADQPITFRAADPQQPWYGILVGEMGDSRKLQNVTITNAVTAISPLNDTDYCRLENITVDSADVGYSNLNALAGGPTARHVYIRNCSFLNISDKAIMIPVTLNNLPEWLEIADNLLRPSVNHQGTGIWIRPIYENAVADLFFRRFTISGNQIEYFARGINVRVGVGSSNIFWSNDNRRLVIERNQIIDCSEKGIRIRGHFALWAHHNVISGSQVGIELYWNSDYGQGNQPDTSCLVLNQTFVDNQLGVYCAVDTGGWRYVGFLGANIFYNNDQNWYLGNSLVERGNYLADSSSTFVDYAQGDYHLAPTSGAIDSGWEDFDLDGLTWVDDPDDQDPDGTRMDAGALYYDPPPQAPVLSLNLSGAHPVLSWDLGVDENGYSDRDIDHFRIYKYYWISLTERITGYVNVYDSQTYTDNEFSLQGHGTQRATYKVQAYDHLSQASSWSNSRSTRGMANLSRPSALPAEYELSAVFPNPFNSVVSFKYALPLASDVDIRIYDLQGRLVYQELQVNQPAGRYDLSWSGKSWTGSDVPSGVYLIILRAEGRGEREGYAGPRHFTARRKVLLVK